MPQIPWKEMLLAHRDSHLIAGVVEDGSAVSAVRLIEKLLRVVPVAGDFAVGTIRVRISLEVHCLFALAADARLVAAALQAKPVYDYPGWSDPRQFVLNSDLRKLIALVLASANLRPAYQRP